MGEKALEEERKGAVRPQAEPTDGREVRRSREKGWSAKEQSPDCVPGVRAPLAHTSCRPKSLFIRIVMAAAAQCVPCQGGDRARPDGTPAAPSGVIGPEGRQTTAATRLRPDRQRRRPPAPPPPQHRAPPPPPL